MSVRSSASGRASFFGSRTSTQRMFTGGLPAHHTAVASAISTQRRTPPYQWTNARIHLVRREAKYSLGVGRCSPLTWRHPFYRASADVRDDLLTHVESGEGNRDHLLQALAWIGDAVVVDRFMHWSREPPYWGQSLSVPPQDYSLVQCVELVPGHSMRPASVMSIQGWKDACPWCHTRLIDLFTVDETAFQLASGPVLVGAIQVATCEVCTAFGTVFGQLDHEGCGQWSHENTRPKYLPDAAATWSRLPSDALTPGQPRLPLFAANQFLPVAFSQLGGHPTWIQDAEYPCW